METISLHVQLRLTLTFGKSTTYVLHLPVVIRLMLADMKPFTVIICWSPRPVLVYGKQPCIISFPEFTDSILSHFFQST